MVRIKKVTVKVNGKVYNLCLERQRVYKGRWRTLVFHEQFKCMLGEINVSQNKVYWNSLVGVRNYYTYRGPSGRARTESEAFAALCKANLK